MKGGTHIQSTFSSSLSRCPLIEKVKTEASCRPLTCRDLLMLKLGAVYRSRVMIGRSILNPRDLVFSIIAAVYVAFEKAFRRYWPGQQVRYHFPRLGVRQYRPAQD